MFTKVEEAIMFATKAHQGQKRKDGTDFICHPMCVGQMIENMGLDDKYVIIAILHDIIEDTRFNYNDIKERFGIEIADAVKGISEDNKIKDYKLRKSAFIDQISKLDSNILLIECADKLHNLLHDYSVNPNSLNDYSERRRWFYFEMQKLLNEKCKGSVLDRLNEMIKLLPPLAENTEKNEGSTN